MKPLERRGCPRRAALLAAVLLAAGSLQTCRAKPWLRALHADQGADSTWSSIFGGGDPAPAAARSTISGGAAAASTSGGVAAASGSGGGSGGGGTVIGAGAAGHNWLLSPTQRARGLTYMGSAERLRVALERARTGKKLTVAVVGGSVTAGAGSYDTPRDAWVDRFERWLTDYYSGTGVNITVNNGAVPGTTSAYMCACFKRHVPEDADIVFVEYAVNDDERPKGPLYNNNVRRPFERLLRKLLLLPSRPAVVLVNSYAWYAAEPHEGVFWSGSAERELAEFSWYYQLPSVSVKACCHKEMVAGVRGFNVSSPREQNDAVMKGKAFYYDHIHPDGNTGHRVLSELAQQLIVAGNRELGHSPVTPGDAAATQAPLPKPMIRDNQASLHDTCFVGPLFKEKSVVGSDGWEWRNEAKGPRPKWGFISNEPGKLLKLKLNTTASAGAKDKPVLIQLAHLRSYQHMGWAEVSCLSGCECPPTRFNGHAEEKKSLLVLHRMYATQHPECMLGIEVLKDTDSGEHKVKVAGAIVSEQSGEQDGLENAGAVEHVHDIIFRSHSRHGHGGRVFDIRNHV